jgi:hypothetical protein
MSGDLAFALFQTISLMNFSRTGAAINHPNNAPFQQVNCVEEVLQRRFLWPAEPAGGLQFPNGYLALQHVDYRGNWDS